MKNNKKQSTKRLNEKMSKIKNFKDFWNFLEFCQMLNFNFNIINKNHYDTLFVNFDDNFDNQEQIILEFYRQRGKLTFCITSSMTINLHKI
jgi:hypothetical protein